jgi:AcrR family transcriptional regulator
MTVPRRHTSRAEQRLRTEERVLDAARQLFGELGYDRTTIRAIAAAAHSDAGLIIRYFRSKAELFSRAACLDPETTAPTAPAELTDYLVATLAERLRPESSGAVAMLRSMLTHPDAADSVRLAVTEQLAGIRAVLPGEDAPLRSGLLSSVLLGVIIGRVMLGLDELAEMSPDEVAESARPAIEALVYGTAAARPEPVTPDGEQR